MVKQSALVRGVISLMIFVVIIGDEIIH